MSRFDAASILILDRLNQVISRLDDIPPGPEMRASDTPASLEAVRAPEPPDQSATHSLDPGQNSYNALRIPASRTTADAVLDWPIFASRYPKSYLIDAVFEAEAENEDSDNEETALNRTRHHGLSNKGRGINEDDIPQLVRAFLELVHIKNPVVDVDTVWTYAHRVAEDGLKWDSASCLVVSVLNALEKKISKDH